MSERKAIPAKLRDKVLREAGYRCANPPCRTTLAIHLHHMIEVKTGGGDDASLPIASYTGQRAWKLVNGYGCFTRTLRLESGWNL